MSEPQKQHPHATSTTGQAGGGSAAHTSQGSGGSPPVALGLPHCLKGFCFFLLLHITPTCPSHHHHAEMTQTYAGHASCRPASRTYDGCICRLCIMQTTSRTQTHAYAGRTSCSQPHAHMTQAYAGRASCRAASQRMMHAYASRALCRPPHVHMTHAYAGRAS